MFTEPWDCWIIRLLYLSFFEEPPCCVPELAFPPTAQDSLLHVLTSTCCLLPAANSPSSRCGVVPQVSARAELGEARWIQLRQVVEARHWLCGAVSAQQGSPWWLQGPSQRPENVWGSCRAGVWDVVVASKWQGRLRLPACLPAVGPSGQLCHPGVVLAEAVGSLAGKATVFVVVTRAAHPPFFPRGGCAKGLMVCQAADGAAGDKCLLCPVKFRLGVCSSFCTVGPPRTGLDRPRLFAHCLLGEQSCTCWSAVHCHHLTPLSMGSFFLLFYFFERKHMQTSGEDGEGEGEP